MSDTDDTHAMQATESTESMVDKPRPLDGLVTSIRAATAPDAPAEVRATAAAACRSLLAAFEAKPGEPLIAPRASVALPVAIAVPAATTARAAAIAPAAITAPASAAAPPFPASAPPILGILAQLRSMSRDQLSAVLKQLVTSPSSPLGGLLNQLAEMSRDQLIARVNQQLRALAPAGAPIPPPTGPRFHLIPIPQVSRRGGAR